MSNNYGKGTSFEYDICKFFSKQDFFTRRSIPIKTIGKQDITDIDVLGIKFTYPFEKQLIICDCKNKIRSKPYERIFWTKGLGTYVGANKEYIALPKVSSDIIAFAKKCEVRVISQSEMTQFNDLSYGYFDYSYYSNFFASIDPKSKEGRQIDEYISILKREYLSNDPYTGLNRALLILNKIQNLDIGHKANQIIFAEAVSVVAYAILDICRDVFGMNSVEREEHITDRLTYGSSDSAYINSLIENITSYANQVVMEKIPKTYVKNNLIDNMKIPAPHYSKNCIGLIERIYNNPDWYIDILNNIDFILYEFVLKNAKFDNEKFAAYNKQHIVEEKLKACKNILYFACSSSRIPLTTVWEQEEEFIPYHSEVKL